MGLTIQAKNLVQNGNSLKVELHVSCDFGNNLAQVNSLEYIVNDSVVFQAYFKEFHNLIEYFVKFTTCKKDNQIYIVKYSHSASNNVPINKCLTTDDGTWRLVSSIGKSNNCEKWNVSLDISPAESYKHMGTWYASLHDDTEITDFELRGVDGSVHLHKAIAAASSPVIRRMFAGVWRESIEGAVDIPDTTKATLQHLKDYIYLDTLPETGLEQLLLLASCYMMPELELRCVDKLAATVSTDNAYDLILFASVHSMSQLLIRILNRVQDGSLAVSDIGKQIGLQQYSEETKT